MVRPSPEETKRNIEALKETRERMRTLARAELLILGALEGASPVDGAPFPYQDERFVLEVLRLMEADDEYRYETSSPRYDGKNFIATTANINEYQSRFFGPMRHEDMRRLFLACVRHLEREGVDFVYRRTTMRYNYLQGDDADTGFRIEIPITYLKGGGPAS